MPEAYQSYLLRLRYLDNGGQATWLITLERPGQPGQERFVDLAALVTFLRHTMALVDLELHSNKGSRNELYSKEVSNNG